VWCVVDRWWVESEREAAAKQKARKRKGIGNYFALALIQEQAVIG